MTKRLACAASAWSERYDSSLARVVRFVVCSILRVSAWVRFATMPSRLRMSRAWNAHDDGHMVVTRPMSRNSTVASSAATTLMSKARSGSQAYTSANDWPGPNDARMLRLPQ